MFAQRRIAIVATASLLIAGVSFFSVSPVRAQTAGACTEGTDLAVLAAPAMPWKGMPLRVMFAAEKETRGELSLIAPDGSVAAKSGQQQGGPPYFWIAEVATPVAGTWHAKLVRDHASPGCETVTREITVRSGRPPRTSAAAGSIWPIHDTWDRGTENLYSAWIEKLFDAPLDSPPSWKALHEVLRDRSRNVLFNYLDLGEDEMGMVFHPDCADMPYFLRAYFAFKLGLPFGYSRCSRGTATKAPTCTQWFNIQHLDAGKQPNVGQETATSEPAAGVPAAEPPKRLGLAASFGKYIAVIGDAVHSGSSRTAAADNNTDYYPVPLTQDALRPGTIYADPFGHILMLTKRVAQTNDTAGVLLAADAQPDGTVAIKRFWRGNFLYVQDHTTGPGFKRFRPIVRERNGALHRLTNSEIASNPQYGNYSSEPSKLSVDAFYDRMDDVMSPAPLDPLRAMKEVVTALDEQAQARVTSVENGRKFLDSGKGVGAMPDGASIFETSGAWEDFATPSRDLRMLIAIDVARGFPDHVARRPERYAMPKDKTVDQVKIELQSALASELASRKFTYTRSDGSPWTLTVKEVVDRAPALEMAYNLNDCVELRWGAPANSEEASTCKRHAPEAQRAKMMKYRPWFHERRRPARGARGV
ncbi:hypothetical protein AFIC_002483 [[Pseudomonas] carboxydohydrogena]|uniref:Uncharacterized protein n=1 Tax=Afipia carboxydohydrogena TaxID=290 RepID=A0ABY8BNG0_AFICR|nr:hypothetical protein [[Pseudomonas] carboxydohydrogena]WEF50926.1 hypothetical protein AFIC_002483 [[Pseudomonas] carboxydohydrogena]